MILAAALSLLVGVSLGLLGGGGSILTLPVLVYVVGLDPRDGIAASLFVVGVTSASAMLGHARGGRVQWKTGFLFGTASMAGAFAGGRLSHFLPARALLAAFTVLMIVTAIAMMRPRREVEDGAAGGRPLAMPRLIVAGVAIGAMTGLVGAGGGFVIVPALTLLCGLPMRSAVGTSLLVITMNSFAGFAGAAPHASIPWVTIAVITAAAVLGSLGGAALASRIPPTSLRKGFAWFIVAMALFMIWKQAPATIGDSPLRLAAVLVTTLAIVVLGRRMVTRGQLGSPSRPA